jgi:preprotein translocase SecF subunit
MPIRIIPDDTKIQFMRLRRVVFPVSLILVVISAVLFIAVGPNYGIDFRGGTRIVLQPPEGVVSTGDIAEVRARLATIDLADVDVQTLTEAAGEQSISIRIAVPEGADTEQQAVVAEIRDLLGDLGEFRSVEVVGPRVSGELARDGIISALVAITAIMIYVWVRFEWQFAVGAVVALLHDVILTLGFFAVVKLDFNLSSIAAILTIVGYSLNDTVVVYDRIRETLRKYKRVPVTELIDRAINETLTRTTVTSLTTWIALWALFVFGGDVVRSFVAAMIFGVAVGTYSSIFIAAPVLIFMRLRGDQLDKVEDKTDAGPAANKPTAR